jgi:D-inositol-3-phosphate glycosyltransferase
VFLIEPEGTSGNWHYAVMLALALQARGTDVVLGTLFPYDSIPGSERVSVVSIGPKPPGIGWRHPVSLQRISYHVQKLRQMRAALRAVQPNIVHVQLPLGKLDFAYFAYLRFLGIRVVYTAFQPLLGVTPGALLERARYQQSDVVLVHAFSTLRQLVAGGIDEARIKRIEHGNFLDLCIPRDIPRHRAREFLGVPQDARVILFFGAIEPRKGLDVLIDAFSSIVRSDESAYLIIAGYPVEDFSSYAQRIRDNGLQDHLSAVLRWIPFEEMQNFFNAADVVVLPYKRISQSGVLQLAYAYARPVVVTNVGGIAEAVSEDGTGLVASGADAQAIAVALQLLLSDKEKAMRMGRRGQELAGTKYSWSAIAQELANLYEEVLKTPVTARANGRRES